jgi:glycosyltransferase involved in cell wall biosynthesis
MHILMLFSTAIPPCDGIASHVVGLAKRLRARGYNITLMTRGSWRGKLEFVYEGFKVVKVPFYPLYPFHVQFHSLFVKKAIKALNPQPDLIHLHSPLVPLLPKKWPIVTTFHTPMLVDTAHIENSGIKTFLIKLMGKTISYRIEKKLLSISNVIIAVSQGVADELKTFYKFTNNLYVIPNMVDIAFYKPTTYFPNEKRLLYIGRLSYRKGLFEIIKSAGPVVQRYPEVKYILVGSGPLKKDLYKLVKKNGLNSHFEFCGEITDSSRIRNYYQEATAVLIPSYYESGPITLLESMACGKAVVTTATGLAKGLIEDGENAILIKPKSVEVLSEATMKLLSSEELCKKLGDAARRTIVEKMDVERNTDKIEEVYHHAIENFKKNKDVKKD